MDNNFLKLVSSPLMNLDHTYRYSGTKLVEKETLSQHIVDTIMMGMKIVEDVNRISKVPVSLSDYVMKATYHDLEEVITGDVPRPLKYHDDATLSSMREVADSVAKELFQGEFSDNWTTHYLIWRDAKDDYEGLILKIVDNLVVVNKVVKEVSLLNNYYMLRVAHEVSQYTTSIRDHLIEDDLFGDENVNKYFIDLLTDAIDVMKDILEKNKEKLPLCSHSMI